MTILATFPEIRTVTLRAYYYVMGWFMLLVTWAPKPHVAPDSYASRKTLTSQVDSEGGEFSWLST